jgi:hypothetical protein
LTYKLKLAMVLLHVLHSELDGGGVLPQPLNGVVVLELGAPSISPLMIVGD